MKLSCIISSFYIKPQLIQCAFVRNLSCIISSFYIKPQPITIVGLQLWQLYYIFILHQTTTNYYFCYSTSQLYYIFILHQTTTFSWGRKIRRSLYYIFILHQTTTLRVHFYPLQCCIISSFYIKPQLSKPLVTTLIWLYYIFILHQTTTTRLNPFGV